MDWKQCTKPPAVIKHPTMPGVLILVKEDEVLPCPPEEEDQTIFWLNVRNLFWSEISCLVAVLIFTAFQNLKKYAML